MGASPIRVDGTLNNGASNQKCSTLEAKIGKFKKIFSLFLTTSYENPASRIEVNFRRKSASSANSGGAVGRDQGPVVRAKGKMAKMRETHPQRTTSDEPRATNYAKQTQFPKNQNELKLLIYNELRTNNYEQCQ